MTPVVEEIKTKAPPKKVWKAWAETYNQSSKMDKATSSQKAFKEGKKGYVVDNRGKKASYKITKIIPGKSFTMTWGNIFLRMYFIYNVLPQPKGSLISCKVKFGGLFVFPVSFFLRKKIKMNLQDTLHKFVQQLEMPTIPQRRIYR